MGSRAIVYVKTPEGWKYKYSHWGASHLKEGLMNKKFWRKGDKNAIKPVLRSAKGYLGGRFKKMGGARSDDTHNFVVDFDIETILMYEAPRKGKVPERALLFSLGVPFNDMIPNGAVYVLDKINSPLSCNEFKEEDIFLAYIDGAIKGMGFRSKIPYTKVRDVTLRLMNLPMIRANRGIRFPDANRFIFLGQHKEYPLDLLLTIGDVIRAKRLPLVGLLEEAIHKL